MKLRSLRAGRRGATWTAVAGGSAAALVATALATGLPTTSSASGHAVRIASADSADAPSGAAASPVAGAVAAAVGGKSAASEPKPDDTPGRKAPADPEKAKAWYLGAPKTTPRFVPPPPGVGAGEVRTKAVPAAFTVTFGPGVPAAAQAAFTYAVGRWAQHLDTTRPIRVHATWTGSLPAGQLGEASFVTVGTNLPSDPFGTTFYPQALYDHLSGLADSAAVDMTVAFNSTAPWYFGTDANPGSAPDFVTTAMHEIGHGLGFNGGMTVDGSGLGQWSDAGGAVPVIYDHFVTANGVPVTSLADGSVALGDALRLADLRFNGPATASAILHTVNPWNATGYSHLSETAYPAASANSLMTPVVLSGEAQHSPGPLALGVLDDIGWTPAPSDTMAPDTTITAGPVEGTTIATATPTFEFTSTETPATFQCRIDLGSWENCSSPYMTPALTDAPHTFAVRSFDAAMNEDLTPATRSFTVDAVPAAPGQLAFNLNAYSVSEGDPASITVTRTGGTDGAVSATLTTSNGTAGTGDYTSTTTVVNFEDGDGIAKTVPVATTEDSDVEGNETVLLSLGSPVGATLGLAAATLTITDDDSVTPVPGTLAFSSATYSVEEGGVATITVTRDGGDDGAVSVNYATTATGTAAGTDYTSTSGTLNFADGDTSESFTVSTTEDSADEVDETISLVLNTVGGGATLGTAAATLTITDDDEPVVVTQPGALGFATASYAVDEGNAVTVTVTRTGGDDGAVAVNYATASGTAGGSDYTAVSGVLNFADGDTSETFTVSTTEDSADEANETVLLTLSDPTNGATVSTGSATLTINDDDEPAPATPVVSIAATDSAATEAAGNNGQFTVSRSGAPITSALVVSIAVGGSATAGSDYTALPATVTIPANQASTTITVTPINDTADEPDETVVVTLTDTAAYDLGTPGSATVTIADDDPAGMTCTIDRRTATTGQTIIGTAGNDVICGSGFADTIKGMGGHDVIYGGAGNDTILGGDGNDTIYGEAGDDIIKGEVGNDVVEGGANNDTILGGDGNDTLRGDDGNDTINGEAGDDTIAGGAGSDTLSGAAGVDAIDGGAGTDSCNAGVGSNPAMTGCP